MRKIDGLSQFNGRFHALLTTVMLRYLEGVEGAAQDEQAVVA